MKDELMICPKAGSCGSRRRLMPSGYGSFSFHCHIHEETEDCTLNNTICPPCEKFLGVVVENERRIDDMSEDGEV